MLKILDHLLIGRLELLEHVVMMVRHWSDQEKAIASRTAKEIKQTQQKK